MNTNKQNIRLSVLMPNYNNGQYLKEAIDSVLNQSFKDFQLFIVDDGSTDRSIEIIEQYTDPRIKLIKKERNAGIVSALNDGLDAINTEFLVRMDGDDICTTDRFEKLVKFMDANPEIGVCSSDLKLFVNAVDENGEVWSGEKDPFMNRAKLVFKHAIGHAASIFRTNVLKLNNIRYTEEFPYSEDYSLFYALKDLTLFSCVNEPLYMYRMVATSNTNQNRDTYKERYFSGIRMVFDDLGLEVNDRNLQLHYDLGFGHSAEYDPKDYMAWKNRLVDQNEKYQVLPQKELEMCLNECWNKLFYKFFALSWKQGLKSITMSQHKWKKFIYFSKIQLNRITGR